MPRRRNRTANDRTGDLRGEARSWRTAARDHLAYAKIGLGKAYGLLGRKARNSLAEEETIIEELRKAREALASAHTSLRISFELDRMTLP